MEVRQPSIVDIPWEDVLFPRVFSFLNYDDLLNLQAAITDCNDPVNAYFAQIKTVDMPVESPEAIQAICERTTCIKELDLSHCKFVRDAMMRLVIKNNPHLTTLNICNCPNLTSSGVQPIVNSKKLISICVRRNHWVTNSFVDLMTIHITQLEEVDLGMCRVDNASLIPLFYSCKSLKKIDIEGNRYITDATLYAIANNCPRLESLNISGSKRVGESSVRFVTDLCPRLRSLRLRGCDRLSSTFIKGIRKNIYLDF